MADMDPANSVDAQPDYSFYVFYGRDLPRLNNEVFTSIQLGSEQASLLLGSTIGDNTGSNISAKSGVWAELTVLYWMWKDVDASFYGLFDPAQMLDLRSKNLGARYSSFVAKEQALFGWNKQDVMSLCRGFEVIMPEQHSLHVVDVAHKTLNNFDFYAMYYGRQNAETLLRTVQEEDPAFFPYVVKQFYSRKLSPVLSTIMRRDAFHRYASRLFEILFEYDRRDTSPDGERIAGQMRDAARILSDAYFALLSDEGQASLQRLPTVKGAFGTPLPSVDAILTNIKGQKTASKDLIVEDTIEVALGIDESYAIHASVTIASLLSTLAREQQVRIFIVHDKSLSAETRGKLRQLREIRSNAEIVFIPFDEEPHKYLPQNRPHVSQATYLRLSLNRLIPSSVQKIIYLDSDVVVTENIL